MKGLILSAIGGLMIASLGCGYADAIRVTVINESTKDANLMIPSLGNRMMPVSQLGAKMFTADYKYPDRIMIQGRNGIPKACDWSMPVVGKQTIRAITMNISTDKSTNSQTCLLSWQ